MDKEGIFFSCLTILVIFEVGYYLLNPNQVWQLGIGVITSVLIVGIGVGVISGVQALSFGLSDTSTRIVFFGASILMLLVRVEIPLYLSGLGSLFGLIFKTDSIPLGVGLFYPNLTTIFITDPLTPIGLFGLIMVSCIMLFMIVSGLMIAEG